MTQFNHYARYYDLVYKDRDYRAEADFVHRQLLANGSRVGTILELGCGTGRHAVEFAKLGWRIDGVDLSEEMVSNARQRAQSQSSAMACQLGFRRGDVRTVRMSKTYTAVISMFHVMSYQVSNEDLSSAISTAAEHLPHGGLFFFDFWYGPGVLSDPPAVRVRRLEDEAIAATRIAEPETLSLKNQVVVHYDIQIRDKQSNMVTEIREAHAMRFWFYPELEYFLASSGFSIAGSGRCYSDQPLSLDTWYGWVLARKGHSSAPADQAIQSKS